MTFHKLLTEVLDKYNIIHHSELIPVLYGENKEFMLDNSIEDLFNTIDNMVENGELKRILYTLPNSNNERIKFILLHRNAEIMFE